MVVCYLEPNLWSGSLFMYYLFIEAFKHTALEWAPLNHPHFKCYIDDTSLVWPHGQENLFSFLFQLCEWSPSKYKMYYGGTRAGKHSILCGPDSYGPVLPHSWPFWSTGNQTVQWDIKYIANLYLCVLMLQVSTIWHRKILYSTFLHWAVVVSGAESLPEELAHLWRVLIANGYSSRVLQRAIKCTVNRKYNHPVDIEEKKGWYSLSVVLCLLKWRDWCINLVSDQPSAH